MDSQSTFGAYDQQANRFWICRLLGGAVRTTHPSGVLISSSIRTHVSNGALMATLHPQEISFAQRAEFSCLPHPISQLNESPISM
jgi:hypothetical protein